MASEPQRTPHVVVTGIGLRTGLGADRESTWSAICAGRSAARFLDDAGALAACPLPEPAGHVDALVDPVLSLTSAIGRDALADASLLPCSQAVDPTRIATLIGLSKGCVHNLARLAGAQAGYGADGSNRFPAEFWERLCGPNAGALLVAAEHGLEGPCLAPVAACATGLVAVLQAVELIRRGACDVALAGSADASLEPMLLAAFQRMGVLARPSDRAAAAVRPWDRDRSGFVVGEGGAVLVLERADHARARGVLPYVEVAGGALGADAQHPTSLNPDPAGLARLIGRALERAQVGPADIDHVNVHGTATRINDPVECRALRRALGEQADRVACSANKSQIGHLLGAAGSAELAIECLAVRDGFAPPTLNLDDPDPACDLDGTPHVGRRISIRGALKLSIGFGGHLAAAVLLRPDGPRRGSSPP